MPRLAGSADTAFLWRHAWAWAAPRGTETADAYAEWYVAHYGALTAAEWPDHPSAWRRWCERTGRDALGQVTS